MDTYRVLRDCRLASGERYRGGAEATLSRAAAKYPLLRGWIARATPPAEAPAEPPAETPRPTRRTRARS